MEEALRECCRDVRIGKILIQRDKSGERRVCLGDPPPHPTHTRTPSLRWPDEGIVNRCYTFLCFTGLCI
jgi:hypothetical protein